MKDPILYLSIFLALAGIFTLINSFADDDDDSDGDGGKYIYNLEYVPIKVWFYFKFLIYFSKKFSKST